MKKAKLNGTNFTNGVDLFKALCGIASGLLAFIYSPDYKAYYATLFNKSDFEKLSPYVDLTSRGSFFRTYDGGQIKLSAKGYEKLPFFGYILDLIPENEFDTFSGTNRGFKGETCTIEKFNAVKLDYEKDKSGSDIRVLLPFTSIENNDGKAHRKSYRELQVKVFYKDSSAHFPTLKGK